MSIADVEELGLAFGTPHLVEKLAVGVDALANEVEVLLHLVHLCLLRGVRSGDGFVEVLHVAIDLVKCDFGYRKSGLLLADLAKYPWVSNRVASDHHSGSSGVVQNLAGFAGRSYVSVGEDWAIDPLGGSLDKVVMDLGAIHLLDGAAVETEEVYLMLVYEIEDSFEIFRILESNAHLDGEESRDAFAQGSEDLVDFLRVAQETATTLLFVNCGGGTAHVEIDASDGV